MINKYVLRDMSAEEVTKLCMRSETDISAIRERVRPIIAEVRNQGDQALRKFTRDFDKVDISSHPIEVMRDEFETARSKLPEEVSSAIDSAAANIRRFHEAQMPQQMWFKQMSEGVLAGEKITPISSVGLYVPRGKGSFPSIMLMIGIPAVVAGVREIVVCTPPTETGVIDAATLYAASVVGIERVFRVGGAQAIAAMAYGTESVPKVRKVMGPGNTYVSAAKRELIGLLDIGVPAGPSEAIILADGSVPSIIAAHDLLIEAEHGPDSSALLVTASASYAEEVERLLPGLIEQLPRQRREYCEAVLSGYGGIVIAPDMEAAIEFVNQYAPEHMEILTSNPFVVLPAIQNAGEILMGAYTPVTLGNFSLGINATLPTGGFAHTYSCVTVFDFLKRSSIGFATKSGFPEIASTAKILAEYEGFSAHANAIAIRQRGDS